MQIKHGLVFDPVQGFLPHDLHLEGDTIVEHASGDQTLDASGCYVIPGLTDLHFHGCVGHDFSDGDAQGLAAIAAYQATRGVTQICPAGLTVGEEALATFCQVAADHCAAPAQGAQLVGIHLEGPFLSKEKKGAQNEAWLRTPNLPLLRRLQGISGGLVKLVTLAPELPGAEAFLDGALDLGIRVSLGHTTADYNRALAAFTRGARHVTHLYNAMPPMTHRAPGVVGAALDTPEVTVELIADGVHVHPSVVRATFAMFGAHRVILVSDSLRAAGLADGTYEIGGQPFTLRGNAATLADGTLAGSVTDLMGCVQQAVAFGIPLHHAVLAASTNPAKALGLGHRFGALAPGMAANVVVLNPDYSLRNVLVRGNLVSPHGLTQPQS